jgi:hypothetical protein
MEKVSLEQAERAMAQIQMEVEQMEPSEEKDKALVAFIKLSEIMVKVRQSQPEQQARPAGVHWRERGPNCGQPCSMVGAGTPFGIAWGAPTRPSRRSSNGQSKQKGVSPPWRPTGNSAPTIASMAPASRCAGTLGP